MFDRLTARLTDARLLQMLALAGLVAWPLAFGMHVAGIDRLYLPSGKPVGGDFVSVYTGGTLLLEGHAAELYDLHLQQQTQGRIVELDRYRALCSYVSPPVVAVVATGLALLPFLWAYVVYSLLMAAALVTALRLLKPHLPALREHGLTALGLSLCFFPMAVTITGGQNTALTLLLLAWAYAALRRGNDVLAGVALGLLCYKPQFALVPCILLLSRGRWRALAATATVAGTYYAIGAFVCGVDWPLAMRDTLATYWPVEHAFNGGRSVSLIGFCEAVLPATVAKPIGATLAVALVGVLIWLWRGADLRGPGLARLWGLAVCGSVLISPHTQWYDGGLVLLAVLLGLDLRLHYAGGISTGDRLLLLGGFFLPLLFAMSATLGFQPMILLPVIGFAWVYDSPTQPAIAPGVSSIRPPRDAEPCPRPDPG